MSGSSGTTRSVWAALALAPLLAGCGGRPPAPARPQPIAYADTLPIREPERRVPNEGARLVSIGTAGEISDVLGPRAVFGSKREALDVDRQDDVVSSAWYERDHRAATMTPAEIGRGPSSSDGPADGVLTIVSAKIQGISPGFTVEDSRGDRYVFKFDPVGFAYLSSAAGVISNRFFYAAGYHVPEDYIFRFSLDRLRVEPGATYEDARFVEHPLTLDIAREALTRTDTLPDGHYLAVASKFVPGVPKGPFYFGGRREDDPNDWYRHEDRRELRGLRVVSAWLNHVDMRFMNTLDSYVAPGYLRHYLIDFAATLGSGTIRPHEPREGEEYNFDFWDTMGRLFTLGFYRAGWEDVEWTPIHPTIGWLRGEDFDPEGWKANWPNEAFNHMTRADAYWGAKLVAAFDEPRIRAAVAAGQLPDEWAADTLATILATRRDRTVEHWYARVSPLERPRAENRGGELYVRFEDVGLRDGPWTFGDTRYEWSYAPAGGRTIHGSGVAPVEGYEMELHLPAAPPRGTATLEVRIVRRGSGVEPKPARVYLRRSENGVEITGLEH